MKADYTPETDPMYRAECQACDHWKIFDDDQPVTSSKNLRRAKSWAKDHLDDFHAEEDSDSRFVQIIRIVGNVA
jgi:hypothetical protein